MFDKHVAVSLAHNQTIISEKVVQVKCVDVLFGILINSTEGIQDDERMILGENLFLDFTFTNAHRLLRDDPSD